MTHVLVYAPFSVALMDSFRSVSPDLVIEQEEQPAKRWPEAYFRLLAASLQDHGLQVVWIGSQDEQSLNERLAAHAGTDATAEFGLDGLLALAAQAVFAVSNDSGPMHVLAAAGKKDPGFFRNGR